MTLTVWLNMGHGHLFQRTHGGDLGPAAVAGAFAGFLFGVSVHSGLTGSLGRRAKPQAQFLHPLTSAQFAFARIVSSAAVLVPLVFAVLILQFVLVGDRLVTEIIPDSLAIGATSYREVSWVLLGRGLLVVLLVWPLMNWMNRTIAWTYLGELVLATVLGLLEYNHVVDWQYTRILLPLLIIGVTLGVYGRAWKTGLISIRSLLIAGGVWALATWVLLHPVLAASPSTGSQFLWYASSVVTCLGWAALIPLPYVAVALEVRRRRHAAAAPQDSAQHVAADTTLFTGTTRTVARVGAACLVLFLLWLSWPAQPAYESYWRSKGYPATLAELDAWYKAVPAEQNRASAYLELARATEDAQKTFYERYLKNPPDVEEFNDHLLIEGNAQKERGKPIAAADWEATETYWQGVTSAVAPELERLATDNTMGSRYPVDLRDGFDVSLPHLARLRDLARQLYLDSLHWTLAGDPGKATDAIDAMIPLANSLSEEPLLISQLVRVAILGIANGAAEEAMNRSVLPDAALARLQQTFATALPPAEREMMMDRAIIGEATVELNYLSMPDTVVDVGSEFPGSGSLSPSAVLFWQLAAPAAGERMTTVAFYDRLFGLPKQSRYEFSEWEKLTDDWFGNFTAMFTPIAGIMLPAISGSYEAEWRVRTQFDVARTAIAVERYRLANGHLPDALQDLVPAYLSAVPMDYFANGEAPLRYRQLGGDSYVVYSIGKDGEDDRGQEIEQWWAEGDITFTVAPLAVRTGPQVAPG